MNTALLSKSHKKLIESGGQKNRNENDRDDQAELGHRARLWGELARLREGDALGRPGVSGNVRRRMINVALII
jgi:hypothetical protein